MAQVLTEESNLAAIAGAIRGKNGSSASYAPSQMAAAISAIPSGGITPTGSISITANGAYDVTSKAEAVVNVSTLPSASGESF